jgi:hypothetical protein
LTGVAFDPTEYSRLKFGSNVIANKFGRDLAIKFYRENMQLFFSNKEIVVIPSAYNMLEIAATLLSKSFIRHLNMILVENNLPIVKWTNMHRTITYFSDYAHMTHEERKNMLAGDSFFINKEFVKNKILLFIDDVIITGTHEEKIKEFMKNENLGNECIFLYYLKYTGEHPDTEATLNSCGVNDVNSFVALTNEPEHQIIVRTCKFLLNGSKHQLLTILGKCSDKFIENLYASCILEEYHNVPRYRENMKLIKTVYNNLIVP